MWTGVLGKAKAVCDSKDFSAICEENSANLTPSCDLQGRNAYAQDSANLIYEVTMRVTLSSKFRSVYIVQSSKNLLEIIMWIMRI